MNESFQKHSSSWVSFSYASFGAAAFMLALGIYMMPLDLWGKGYLTMGILMLVQTTVNVTKTIRDNAESEKLIRKVEDAKTEKLLLNINRNDVS
ncbi:YiaA/YiaB family inner membrane protein [Rhizobium sp.]